VTWLAVGFSALGIAAHHWSHAGHRDGDFQRRAWARIPGAVLAIVAGVSALVLAVVRR
jgi:hypothetical protein